MNATTENSKSYYPHQENREYIYFIRIGEPAERLFKIGTTNNINRRMKEHKKAYKEFGRYSGVEIDGTIRQMTHKECEALQTLSADYTRYEQIDGEVKEVPKGARYEMIGNGWTVDVIAHILKHLPKE